MPHCNNALRMQFKLVILPLIVLSLLILISNSSSYASQDDPYQSGDDAGISDSSERYINQPEKGPSFHTTAFMNGYYDGFDACSGGSRGNDNDDRSNQGDNRINTSPQTTGAPTQITFYFHLQDIDLAVDALIYGCEGT